MIKAPWPCALILAAAVSVSLAQGWPQAQVNSEKSQRAIKFANRYAAGWLSHADPATGLLPRQVSNADQFLWNARDCAADNYPFLVLTGEMTGSYYLRLTARHILDQERRLTARPNGLPDDFIFATGKLAERPPKQADLVFGAAEYAKDGLIPVTEWLGPGLWSQRMDELLKALWAAPAVDSPAGKLASDNVEVNGDLLQACSRMYWLTGDDQYRQWAFRLADHYLLHASLLESDSLKLRDHGCEIIGGLAEACVIAWKTDPPRYERYRPAMRAVLDSVLAGGVNADGMMYVTYNPRTGKPVGSMLSDGWGYVYNAFLTMAAVENEPRYEAAVVFALSRVHAYDLAQYEGFKGSADQYADIIEGAINLLARIDDPSAWAWVDRELEYIYSRQRHDGIIEGWYGDGNSTRTMLMRALHATQGITPEPWTEDLQIGAVPDIGGRVRVFIKSEFPWRGHLRFDRPRHRDYLKLPFDYARINQFPEWFTAEAAGQYEVTREGQPAVVVSGQELFSYPLALEPNRPLLLTVRPLSGAGAPGSQPASQPAMRTMRYQPGSSPEQATAWQGQVRARLAEVLKINDLAGSRVPLRPKLLSSEPASNGHSVREVEFSSTADRRIKALVTVPAPAVPGVRLPAVVCIHGHGGQRRSTYDPTSIYKGFAAELAATGYVTIACDVGQHKLSDPARTLIGDRLWDLIRCVDLLESLPEVDAQRIGCAGLSLGGEMAMWLAAMDQRVQACVSCGFLTWMDRMEEGHCMCWKTPGLRELVDFPDIYALIAPRPLQCQNGLQEPPTQFPVTLAREALVQIKPAYADLGMPGHAGLAVHPGGHEVDLPALLAFFRAHLPVPATQPDA